jgi:hypothetical protein
VIKLPNCVHGKLDPQLSFSQVLMLGHLQS